ncbi:PREDICTED: putative inactive serine/threonine-protein kinase At5g11400 isoform X1 [Camelina sativa]|uniref:Inactive serine/threonine-protein kinase At5g11400 isoform X1 n=1 Tax=Camelina sativa TaxID=90675 RepID=A0ABM0XW42_CAMSA|nr:PREDICTED: putative inactive serine/threonine-protein kinase At5g11400 isoform X1 [Camelina sativa]
MGNCLKPLKEQPPPPPSISPKPLIINPESNDGGGFRTIYQGYINETTFAPSRTGIAVSVMECYQDDTRDIQDWKEEVKSLGSISHPNLAKLLGYCCEENRSFLVFEYFHKGSLDRHIFGKEGEALLWEIRVKIAIGAAQSIAFLHSVKNTALYRELRMYNILLDEHYNTKLFYLVSNKLCLLEDSITTAFIGRTEYVAPEYVISGHLGMKSDVYTFGVILFEILTGLKASDGKKNKNLQSLHVWTKPFLSDQSKMRGIIDLRLGNDYPVNAATQMGKLIKRCIKLDTSKRPSMQQVLDRLSDIAEIKD